MLIVALTGGIGSGKTTVGNLFSAMGAQVVDSDQIAKEIVERGSEGFNQVIAAFGDTILKNGELDRTAIAALVFNDPDKRVKLEEITHPLIRKRFTQIVSQQTQDCILINQIPLLYESQGAYKFDYVITISISAEQRIERLKKRGMSLGEIQNRIQAQATDSQRESIADSVIINEGSEEELLAQVASIWNKLKVLNSNKS